MSNLNDLIHTNAQNAFAIGVRTEQERIIKIIQDHGSEDFTAELIELIKGEQK
jgi:hypothetical protein